MRRDYPERPILGIGAVIVEGDRFVLVQRAAEPHRGEWTIPGGVLECGESLREGVIREAREELSLDVEPVALVEVFERIIRDEQNKIRFHYVVMDYLCRVRGGRLHARDDVSDARWLNQTELEELQVTEGTLSVLKKALRAAKQRR